MPPDVVVEDDVSYTGEKEAEIIMARLESTKVQMEKEPPTMSTESAHCHGKELVAKEPEGERGEEVGFVPQSSPLSTSTSTTPPKSTQTSNAYKFLRLLLVWPLGADM
ncbi:uncharacterized protein A4U43_C02F13630 [Asparagus officinalis]|uniref:Uncharacterized protein n=1 Tax=Asparagus officinalis TaxID=4686 RepID=A0A5P1FI28_ASPOF|nr:uncharacterized protein A4U43_C02F13630 [Asparagus officinalis]